MKAAAKPFYKIEETPAPRDKGFGRQQSSDREKDFRGTPGSKKTLISGSTLLLWQRCRLVCMSKDATVLGI
jgi:hypothetical protein